MNILDVLAPLLSGLDCDVKKGFLPNKPDTLLALFEYDAAPPEHHFGGADFIQNVQTRARAPDAAAAYELITETARRLNHYHDLTISIIQTTSPLDIGPDTANPPRREYTANFEIRRYGTCFTQA